jgi:hypothetical protein
VEGLGEGNGRYLALRAGGLVGDAEGNGRVVLKIGNGQVGIHEAARLVKSRRGSLANPQSSFLVDTEITRQFFGIAVHNLTHDLYFLFACCMSQAQ